ncbi:MAG: YbcC family protein [Luteolibacter sp.]
MNAPLIAPAATTTDLDLAIAEALERIAPLWPLEHFVAVNPFMGFAGVPFADACATLRRTLGKAPVQTPEDYLAAWKSGLITAEDLAAASDTEWPLHRLLETLENADHQPLCHPVASFADLLDETLPHARWSGFIAEEIAKWCAVHFDRNQTTWVSPWRHMGLFAAWKSAATHDLKPETFGLPGFRAFVSMLPDDPRAVIRRCFAKLDPQGVDAADFLHRQLANVSGWAGHVRYLVREDAMRGNDNPALVELLAIRLAYDAALHRAFGHNPQIAAAWRNRKVKSGPDDLDQALARWQSAYEAGYQRNLAADLTTQPSQPATGRPRAQAVFCIDVRSEIVRRHLEAALPGTHTLGFAGFFGFPVAHQPAHACKPAPRCPVLLVPPVISREPRPDNAARIRSERGAWKAFQNSATSCFTFVESLGLAFSGKLLKMHQKTDPHIAPAPTIENLTAEERASLAEGALRGMSLTENFARLVVICGHGSHSANNPFASSLDCGACGGHAGEVNARLAANTLNNPEVRAILAQRDIFIPQDTHFIAARHDTLGDDFQLYETEAVPASHQAELAELEAALQQAGAAARREGAPRLGLAHLDGPALDRAVRERGSDIAQVRPEWGLANNAALIAAPRSRTASLKLDGRTFLHEYDPAKDPESNILTVILTAPVVVASWINLQYYASRIDPANFAAGNKTIHQVVAGIGVIEGNAGDLRGGLPLQSIHDGKDFVHEPRRLTVFIESETSRIDAVLDAHPAVKQLFDHEWIHLVCLTGKTAQQRHGGKWRTLACQNLAAN